MHGYNWVAGWPKITRVEKFLKIMKRVGFCLWCHVMQPEQSHWFGLHKQGRLCG